MEVNSEGSPGHVTDAREPVTAFDSPTFDRDVQIRVGETVGAASISPSGRDVVLASREGLHIIDLDSPYSPPRHLAHYSPWEVADVQWSPFASRDYWIVSTSNQKALVWNLELPKAHAPIQHTLHAHSRAITDINFSAHHPDVLATCAVDSYVHCWDLRRPIRPAMTFADWNAGATQVKWNRQDEHIVASSHDKFLRIWDDRKGAYPLRSIEAHTTKIYGLDWNRTRPTALLTCSLDKTIKFWDFAHDSDEPERVIRTVFPVWRARHTPFGLGVLAMPQRGNYDLHLYDRRLDDNTPRDGLVKPVHSFEGHKDQVKEFLWRPRGAVEGDVDNREFQLISWGMDRELHLHRMDPSYLQVVGHNKGQKVQGRLNLTRQGAVYKTFHEDMPKAAENDKIDAQVKLPRPLGLGALVSAAGMSKAPLSQPALGDAGFASTSISMYGRRQMRRTMSPIKWMEGVKMGHRRESLLDPFFGAPATHPLGHHHHLSWDARESLSDEMTYVARKYKKVNFEKADVHRRAATVTLHGPWALEGKPAFLRVNLNFPEGYPLSASAVCTFERTTAAISEDMLVKLSAEASSITSHYLSRKTGCLEPLITYLLGERDLEQSIAVPIPDILDEPDESSSDEDPVGDEANLETSATDTHGIALLQANVPLPKACGAYWSNDGRLICFFPPKPEPKPLFDLHALRTGERSGKSHRQFEGFGRIAESSPSSKERTSAAAEDAVESDDTSSTGSYASSTSSSSSEPSDDISRLPARFKPPSAWRAATLKFHKSSSHSSGGLTKETAMPKPKSVISIHDFSKLLPAKKPLAERYLIFGDGPKVCTYNAQIASENGMDDLAAVWTLCEHILFDKVPLEILEQSVRKEPILVLAKRNMVRVKRRDSAAELQLDEPQSISNPSLVGRVKWARHPLTSLWLIPALFSHFEALADIQMLAMLSCLFWEPAARGGVPNALMDGGEQSIPIAMKTPAFSLDYFPTKAVAWSLFQSRKSKDSSGTSHDDVASHGREAASWDYFSNHLGVYGSAESSNGPWSADLAIIGGSVTPYSIGNTPPGPARASGRNTSFSMGPSNSPDFSQRSLKRSVSNMSAAQVSFNRSTPRTASTSPNDKYLPETELSTSAPSGGVTWASATVYSTSGTPSPEKRRRFFNRRRSNTFDGGYDSSDDDQPAVSSTEDTISVSPHIYRASALPVVRVRLKNQHLFNDDGYASTPLLDPKQADRYRTYRESYAEQLSMWGLAIPRAEMLKFNGLASYWSSPSEEQAAKEDLYSRSERLSNMNEPRQSLLTMAAAQHQTKALHSPSSASHSPRLAPAKPITANVGGATEMRRTSSQRLNPAAKPFVPKTSTPPPFTLRRAPSPSLEMEVNGAAAERPPRSPRKSLCVICWQPILGLSSYCPSGTHLLHAECIASLASDALSASDDNQRGVDCFCTGIPTLSSEEYGVNSPF